MSDCLLGEPCSDPNLREELEKNACLTESKVCELTSLSAGVIRKLVLDHKFPQPRRYHEIRRKFWVAGDVLKWLRSQQEQHQGDER